MKESKESRSENREKLKLRDNSMERKLKAKVSLFEGGRRGVRSRERSRQIRERPREICKADRDRQIRGICRLHCCSVS